MRINCPECSVVYEVPVTHELKNSQFFICTACNHQWEEEQVVENQDADISEIIAHLREGFSSSDQVDSVAAFGDNFGFDSPEMHPPTIEHIPEQSEKLSSVYDLSKWARFLTVVGLIMVLLLYFRQPMIDTFPPLYSVFRLATSSIALPREKFEISELSADIEYSGNQTGLRLTFALLNIDEEQQEAPALQVFLLDQRETSLARFLVMPNLSSLDVTDQPMTVGEELQLSVFLAPIPDDVTYVALSYLHPTEQSLWLTAHNIFPLQTVLEATPTP